MIKPSYEINEQTIALLPAKQIEYETIVMEHEVEYLVDQPSFQIVRENCFDYASTYDGRRDAIIHHTNFIQKTPIPINPSQGIYFFPTHSPSNINNSWIAFQHIERIKSLPQKNRLKGAETMIYFKDGQTLIVDVCIRVIRAQMKRTETCMVLFREKKIMLNEIYINRLLTII